MCGARLGFGRIDQLLDTPRAPLTLRFGREVFRRIDQAVGRLREPIDPVSPPHMIAARLSFPEPLLTPEALSGLIARLARNPRPAPALRPDRSQPPAGRA